MVHKDSRLALNTDEESGVADGRDGANSTHRRSCQPPQPEL